MKKAMESDIDSVASSLESVESFYSCSNTLMQSDSELNSCNETKQKGVHGGSSSDESEDVQNIDTKYRRESKANETKYVKTFEPTVVRKDEIKTLIENTDGMLREIQRAKKRAYSTLHKAREALSTSLSSYTSTSRSNHSLPVVRTSSPSDIEHTSTSYKYVSREYNSGIFDRSLRSEFLREEDRTQTYSHDPLLLNSAFSTSSVLSSAQTSSTSTPTAVSALQAKRSFLVDKGSPYLHQRQQDVLSSSLSYNPEDKGRSVESNTYFRASSPPMSKYRFPSLLGSSTPEIAPESTSSTFRFQVPTAVSTESRSNSTSSAPVFNSSPIIVSPNSCHSALVYRYSGMQKPIVYQKEGKLQLQEDGSSDSADMRKMRFRDYLDEVYRDRVRQPVKNFVRRH